VKGEFSHPLRADYTFKPYLFYAFHWKAVNSQFIIRSSQLKCPKPQNNTNMPRKIKSGLIQMSLPLSEGQGTMEEIKEAMIQKHIPYIEEAGRQGVQILCLQEIFSTPYFCPGQDKSWYASAEPMPGPTVERMAELARKYAMVIIVPIYEREQAGVLYNTAAVIDADGTYLGKYRKNHIPHTSGFWEKFFFKPGNLGYPVFETRYARIGVYICYDRHFPEGARILGLNGAEIVYNPSATVAGLSQYLWKLEQPAHAAANGYFMGCINRVGTEAPWNLGKVLRLLVLRGSARTDIRTGIGRQRRTARS
jgi:beta-ureidopropionase